MIASGYTYMRVAEVTEHIAATVHKFHILIGHCKASLSLLNLSRIRSTSICGVLIPDFDFF